MSRFSLRLRLTLAFALVMALVFAAMGFFVFARLERSLTHSLDQTLHAQLTEAAHRASSEQDASEGPPPGLIDRDSSVLAQLIDPSGAVLRSSPPGGRAMLVGSSLGRVARGGTLASSGSLPGLRGEWRMLAAPVDVGGRRLIVAVAGSLRSNEEALHHLLRQLLIAGPVALLLAALAGWGLAAGALRPVELMRRRAAEISAATPGQRLPVSPSGDEIARLGATLNDMLARVEAGLAHERRFLADASHELRTPLALLKTELELALRRPRPAGELELALRSAAEETDRLTRLAEDLLLIARSDQEGLPLRRSDLAVSELLAGIAERFAGRAADSGRRVEAVGVDGVRVTGDRLRLEQALDNLVDNALRYGAGTVRLDAHADNGAVELHVRDEGAGFPPAFLARAFERFSRADEARSRGGSGLGLAIVQVIAAAHGGSAGARNTEQGADVWIALPV